MVKIEVKRVQSKEFGHDRARQKNGYYSCFIAAQAAKESGWGTSRFALEGNAIFGQWTWTGQGIEPLNKGKHEGHKILRFPILRASVKAYKNNLNTHKGYSEFKKKDIVTEKEIKV